MRTAASCVILPPQQLTTSCLPIQEAMKKTKIKQTPLSITLPVFQSSFQKVFPKRSHDSLEREGSRPAIRDALQSRHGRTPDTLCGVLQKSFESRPDCNSVRPIRGAEGGVSQTPPRFSGETLPPSTCRSNLRNYHGGKMIMKKTKKKQKNKTLLAN